MTIMFLRLLSEPTILDLPRPQAEAPRVPGLSRKWDAPDHWRR